VHADWARTTRAAVSRHGTDATYVNFTGEASAEQVRASYPPATFARLVDVKRRYDPTNMFRLNQNISPHPLTN
jgi:FAD/FMN-containing dehydrogenase